MKKVILLLLIFILILCFSTSALATLYGEVHLNNPNSHLNLRKRPSTSAAIIGYMKHGTVVEILDFNVSGTRFHKIKGTSYDDYRDWTGRAIRTGYGHEDYIWGYGK